MASESDASADAVLRALRAGWDNPARTYKPHTRWWWPGNALTKADITWQLEQMAAQGMGGVEIMSAWKMYEKGNNEYLSPEFLALVRHAVAEARRLDMEVAITFGPGWSFGGSWVPKADQSKALCVGSVELDGGSRFSGALPQPVLRRGRQPETLAVEEPESPVAVVAGRMTGTNQLEAGSLTVLTERVPRGAATLEWDVPPGRWRLMAFWLKFTGQECQAQTFQPPPKVIDHLSQGAVERYCDYLGGTFEQAVGGEFGRTVDSFFCDSFEIQPVFNSLLWSTDTLAGFQKHAGYDLAPYLPAIWFDVGALTPRVRYDLGEYLSQRGLDTFFKTFGDWCAAHRVQARIQPHYRFTEELVRGAGATARPETEVTTARFEPVADPRKATASGARFYGREIVSAEAYTFIHPARYRTDLQDLKIATDAFLRDGITQFYNHGYFASPEAHVAPGRDMPWANRISHWNTWWPYYHHVAAYVARSCSLLRQGRLVADVLIYSPQATEWSERALWGSERRVMPYGDLAKTLVANGYDFDIVNDDLLQHRAAFRDGRIEISGHTRRVLILPRATVVPAETMRAIEKFARAGGTVVALEELPAASAGLRDFEAGDREVRRIVTELFGSGTGRGVFLKDYTIDRLPFTPNRKPYAPTPPLNEAQRRLLGVLERVTPPDFALAGRAQSDGLTFIHKQVDSVDVYFVCNLQPSRIATDVTFRVTGKSPRRWDAMTGEIRPVTAYRADAGGTVLPIEFEAWESAFFVFAPGPASAVPAAGKPAAPPPEAWELASPWDVCLEGHDFDTLRTNLTALISWTDDPRMRHFSGTGRYECEFELPPERMADGFRMVLDLGRVGTIAEVLLNGQPAGVAWMAPHRVDITKAVRKGKNKLVVLVTNTLINHVAGLKEPPEVPLELQPRLGKSNPAVYANGRLARNEMSETYLPLSGLVGPVRISYKAEAAAPLPARPGRQPQKEGA